MIGIISAGLCHQACSLSHLASFSAEVAVRREELLLVLNATLMNSQKAPDGQVCNGSHQTSISMACFWSCDFNELL